MGCRLMSSLKSQHKETGHSDLRSGTEKSINRLFKVNGILLCVTLNGALNLYAV